MATSFEEYKKNKEKAYSDAEQRVASTPSAASARQNNSAQTKQPRQTEQYKVWRDWRGNVNISDTQSGKTTRYYQNFGMKTKSDKELSRNKKEGFLTDTSQAMASAMRGQGAGIQSLLATGGLAIGGLIHGDNNYQPEVGSWLWRLQENAEASTDSANRLQMDAQSGRSELGRRTMQLVNAGTAFGFQRALDALLPGSGSALMYASAGGSAAEEARQQGKSISTQVLKGAKSAAIAWATENLSKISGLPGKTGEGLIDDYINKATQAIADKGGNAVLLRIASSMASEGAEEVIEDYFNYWGDKFLAKVVKGDYTIDELPDAIEIFYDGLIGGLLGGFGGAVQANVDTRRAKANGVSYAQQIQNDYKVKQGKFELEKELKRAKRGKNFERLANIISGANKYVNGVFNSVDAEKAEKKAATAAAPVAPVEAAPDVAPPSTPAAPEAPKNAAPVEFNSKLEGESGEVVTNPVSDATIGAQPETASKVAAQPQEGKTDGRTVSDSKSEGRQDVSSEMRPGQAGDAEEAEALRAGRADASGTVDAGEADKRKAEKLKEHSERAVKLSESVEKHAKGASVKVRDAIFENHVNDEMPDDELVQYISEKTKDNAAPLYTDYLIGKMVEKENRGELFSMLEEAGIGKAEADKICDEVFGERANPRSSEDDVPFTMSDEPKAPSKAKTEIQVGKMTVSMEDGHRVATVTDTSGKKAHIGGDVDTVRVAQKYTRKKGDKLKRGRNGYRLIQHGNTDNYTVIDRKGNIVGKYTSFEAASKAMGNKGGVFNVASFNLGDSICNYRQGYCELDTDTAFTDANYLTTQGRSMASDDLGILTSRHGRMGYTGNTTTDVINVEISFDDFKRKARQEGSKYAAYDDTFLEKLWSDRFDILLHGKKNDYGEYVKLPGIWGANGKHYVFAGWTASKSRKGVAIFMEEGKYKEFRHRMTGGLKPSEIKQFNPAKYLTNQGTYWTPSEANTGVKCGNLIVMADIMNVYHNVTRMFIRSSDLDSDMAALIKAGYTEEAAKAKCESVKAGESFMLTGDLIVNCVDGMGFVDSQELKGHDFQARGPGGLKGYLLNCDFKGLYNDNIPVDPDHAFTITNPETGEVIAGIRHVDKKTGVEVLNKWGKWQAIKDAQGIVFESMVKFKDEYAVYKEVDGKQVIDPDASTKKFQDAMGDTDLRSIPIESAFGRSWDEDSSDTGRIKGYTRRTLSQVTRSVDGLPEEFAEKLLKEGFYNPVEQILSSPKDFLRALGVDGDSMEMPASGDAIAYIAAANPDAFVNSNLGKKMALDLVTDLAEKARGGQLYLKNSEHAYQYISPDPFGLLNLMTQFQTQMQDAFLGSTAEMKKSGNPLFNFALKGNREIKNKQSGERYQGQIYSSKLAEGETMAARLPNNELTDSQLRQNVRNEIYEKFLEKYGFGNTAAFFALNDTLALNMDNDYDGDTAFLFQAALAEALKKAQQNLGKSKNEKGRVVRNWELFTERGMSKAAKDNVNDNDIITAAVKVSLNAPEIATMDRFINLVDELPNSWLKEIGKDKHELAALFSTAYKASYDFAKDGKFDKDFAQAVVDAQEAIAKLLESHGYYVKYDTSDKKGYKEFKAYFLPALARYEFSPKQAKRDEVSKAWALQEELNKKDGKKAKKTVIDPGDALISQFYKNQALSDIAPSEYKKAEKSYTERIKFIEDTFPWKNRTDSFDYRTISAIAPASYSGTDPDIWYKLGEFYTNVVNKKNGYAAQRAAMKTLYNAIGLDSTQFESLMSMALYMSTAVDRYSSTKIFLNFDQGDGSTPVTEIIKSKMRIDGTLSRLERALNGVNEELHEVIKPYQEAKNYYESLIATRSEELDLKRELQAQMAELDSEVEWLTNLLNKFKFSEKTFEDRVKRNNFVAAMMGQEDEISRFKEKVAETSKRLDSLENDAASKCFLTETVNGKIRELNKQVKAARDAMNAKVDSTLLAVQMLNDAKAEYEAQFEETETKKWLYGYDRIGETGIESERKQIETIRKLDLLLVLNGDKIPDTLLRPETAAFIDKHLLGLVSKTPNMGQSINGEAKGWFYELKKGVDQRVQNWIANNGDLMMKELGIDLSDKVAQADPTDDKAEAFKNPPPSGEPTTSEYKQGVRKESNEEPPTPPTEPPSPPPGGQKPPKKEATAPKPEKAAAEQKAEAEKEMPKSKPEPVPRETTYGIRFDRVSEALNRISEGFGEGAQTIIPDSTEAFLGDAFGQARHDLHEFGKSLTDAFNAEDDGATLRAFAKELPERIKNTAALQTLLGDPSIGTAAKIAQRLADSADSKNPLVFQTAAAEFAEVLAKEAEELPKTLDRLAKFAKAIEKAGPIAKFFTSTNIGGRLASTFIGYQRNFSNIMMGLDNFDKFANGPGYEVVKTLEESVFKAGTLLGNATFNNMKAREEFNKTDASKKKVNLEVIKQGQKETHTISMAEAVDFLHTLRTIEESKINAWDKMVYYLGESDSLRINNEGQYKNVREALENAVLKDKDAKAFYDSFTNGYAMYANPSKDAIAKASGRNVETFADGLYYPLWSFTEKTAMPGSKGFDYGMDDMLYTKSRLKYEGGAIRILDPTERFNTYASLADKVVTNAEFGAMIDRLNRGGIGDNLEKLVEKRYGKGHTDIIKQTVKNANDFRAETDEASSVLRAIRLNIQTGALFGNFGSMLKQYPSVFNSVGVVDIDDILYGIGAMFDKGERARASELGTIKNRFLGAYDPDVHDAFDGKTAFNKFFDNITEKAPWLKFFSDGFQRIDAAAIKTIYLAARHNVMKEGLTESDPNFEQKVLDKFKTAFLRTQPQFNKLLRPYVQATDDEIIRMFGMFKTQPLQNFNTMIRAIGEYNTAKEKYGAGSEEFKQTSKQLTGVIAGQATASLMFGLLGVVAKLLYHRRRDLEDEEGNLDAGKVMARVLMNAAEASGGMMVFGDAAMQFLIDRLSGGKTNEFYGLSAGAISSVRDAVDAITSFAEKPTKYNAKKAAGYIAQLFGIPLNNAYAILNSAIMYTKDMAGGNEGNYDDILKYLDAEEKAAKKAEEKAAKAEAKAAEKAEKQNGADMLADTAKQNSSQSKLNSAEEQKEPEVSTYLKRPYKALVDAGMSPERSQYVLDFIDTDDNNSIKQAEMLAFYRDNPDYEDYVIAMWNSYGYKTSWEDYKKKKKVK